MVKASVPSDLKLESEKQPAVIPPDQHNGNCNGEKNCNCKTMNKPLQNASQFAKRFYGLHFAPGVAQYQEGDAQPYNIFINQDVINRMDASFSGKPVFVNHRHDVRPEILPEADGLVVRSFFNQADGKQWCEFLITSDKGHDAIKRGYQLSNAYQVENTTSGGQWHAVPYSKEVVEASYDHLALVPNPRYRESVVFTPEEFKKYNEDKSLELKLLTNSKEEKKTMFNFFKKTRVENSDLDSMSVTLPRSNVEVALSKLINDADSEMSKDKKIADMSHMVKANEKEMSVGELIKAHEASCAELAKSQMELAEAMKKAEKVEVSEDDEMDVEAKGEDEKENVEESKDKAPAKKDNPKDSSKEDPKVEAEIDNKKMNANMNFNKLKQAEKSASQGSPQIKINAVEYGKQLYGSK